MTGIDTNVVVRFLVADDEDQHLRARAVLASRGCFVPDTVLLETVWVLASVYRFSNAQIEAALRRFLGLPNVHLADPPRIAQALQWFADGMDFADALHLASALEVETFLTFDRRFVARAKGKGSTPVSEPDALS